MNIGLVVGSLTAASLVSGIVTLAAPNNDVGASTISPKNQVSARSACSQHAWPYYPGHCLRDLRRPLGRASEARLVYADPPPH
jgi:hypothetical protein